MPAYRFITTLAVALFISIAAFAQAPAPAPNTPANPAQAAATPAPPTPAELILDAAIKKLRAIKTVSADLLETVDMLGQSFSVEGHYLRASGNRSKLLLILVGLGDAKGRMQQVCDGQTLWDYSQVLDSQSCRKLQIQPVLQRLDSPDCDPTIREKMLAQLGFAGPDALLAGLRAVCTFNQLQDETLKGTGNAPGIKIWVVRGEWKDRSALSGPGQPPMPVMGALPPYVPNDIEIWIGQEDGWPYKVQLAGKSMKGPLIMRQDIGPDGRPIGAKIPVQKEKPSEIKLTYKNVNLSPNLTGADFAFAPPQTVQVMDGTQDLTSTLDQHLQQQAAQKKSDATKAGGPLLEQSIPVPKAPADSTNPLAPPKS
jgi:hypothetical protein